MDSPLSFANGQPPQDDSKPLYSETWEDRFLKRFGEHLPTPVKEEAVEFIREERLRAAHDTFLASIQSVEDRCNDKRTEDEPESNGYNSARQDAVQAISDLMQSVGL